MSESILALLFSFTLYNSQSFSPFRLEYVQSPLSKAVGISGRRLVVLLPYASYRMHTPSRTTEVIYYGRN